MSADEAETAPPLPSVRLSSSGAATAHPPPTIPDHELLRPIGRGAYGQVWLARTTLGTLRAVKVVYRSSFEDERPFEREFKGIQRFEPLSRAHEGFVDVLQVGRNDAGGYFYYVMELADDVNVAAEVTRLMPESETQRPKSETDQSLLASAATYTPKTLRTLLRPASQPSILNPQPAPVRLPIDACVQIAITLTMALGRLHKEGLVHRDIKPSNIIFVGGLPKLADIGLVASVTEARSFVGTEGFIPPEGPGVPQADLYSLGKVLYEMSNGKDRHDFPELPTDVRELPDRAQLIEFNEVVLKSCHHDPQRRYQSAEEMHADLALLQSGKSVRHVRQLERRLERMKKYGLIAAALLLPATGITLFKERQAWVARKHAAQTERLRNRAVRAEQEGAQKLWQAYLAEARATRWSGKASRRFDSLAAISNAALLPPTLIASNKLALRNEAIAAMALADVRMAKEASLGAQCGFDQRFERAAFNITEGGEIAVIRLADGQELMRLPGHGLKVVFPPQFSPDGKHLAVRYNDETGFRIHELRVWNLERKEMVYQAPTPISHEGHDFSADGRRFACASRDGMVLVLEVGSWREVNRFKSVRSAKMLRFNPSATKLAVSGWDESVVRIHDVRTGATDHSLAHHGGPWGLDWRPDGNALATACGRHIHIWDTGTGRELIELKEHKGQCTHVAFSHGGDLLASAGWDGLVRLWNPVTGQELVHYESRCWHLHFSPDDRLLANVWHDAKVGLLEVNTGRELSTLGAGPSLGHAAAFSPDGRLLASAGKDGVDLWDVPTRRQIGKIPFTKHLVGKSHGVLFHPDGRSLFTLSGSGLQRWPIRATATSVLPGSGDSNSLSPSAGERAGVRGPSTNRISLTSVNLTFGPPERFELPAVDVFRAAMDAAGDKLALLHPAGSFVLYLRETNRIVRLGKHGNADSIAISPDGGWVATATWKGTGVKVWSAASGKLEKELPVSGSAHVAFSSDGQRLVSGNGSEFQFWEIPLPVGQASSLPVQAASPPHGSPALTSPEGKSARQVSAEAGAWQSRRSLPRSNAGDVAGDSLFAKKGKLLAIAHSRTRIKLLSPDGGQELATLEADPQELLALSADGSYLAARGSDDTLQLWDLRLIRQQLAAMNLDWDLPSDSHGSLLTPATSVAPTPMTITVLTNAPRASVAGNQPRMVSQVLAEHERLLLIPSRDPLVSPDLIDLSRHYNASLLRLSPRAEEASNNLATMPRGIHTFAGTEFDVRGAILLGGSGILKYAKISHPEKVSGIPVGRKFRLLHLLHSTGWFVKDGAEIGSCVIHYADGRQREAPIVYGEDVRSADAAHGPDEIARGALAWKGTNDVNFVFRIWKGSLENPRPEAEVARIDYVSKMTRCNPYLIAMTVEGDTPPQAYPPHVRKNRPVPIDLSAHYNWMIDKSLDSTQPGNNLAPLPTGVQMLGGVPFDVRGIVQLTGTEKRYFAVAFPDAAQGIRVDRRCARLHVLHGAMFVIPNQQPVSSFLIRYADGGTARWSIRAGVDVRDWWCLPNAEEPSDPIPVWTGQNNAQQKRNATLRLFKSTWDNLRPGAAVESIDYVSGGTRAAPFLIALTAEP